MSTITVTQQQHSGIQDVDTGSDEKIPNTETEEKGNICLWDLY